MKRRLYLLTLVLSVLVSACNLPVAAPVVSGESLFTQVPLTLTAVAEQTQLASATPAPGEPTATTAPALGATATSTSLPCNQVSFVSDVTIPDNANITVNQGFTKTWKLRNTGSCSWTSGYQVVFDSGDQMGGPASQQLTNGTVAPGETLDVSVDMVAPGSAGTYKGNWKLRDQDGVVFGLSTGPFWVQIQAVSVAPAGWPTFKKGNSGVEVRAIQHLLIAHGENLNVDGDFGPITESKVESFQFNTNGLAVDGIVGPQTWSKLIIQVKQGNSGHAVRAVQRLLNVKSGTNLNIDGIFGPQTDDAVRDWQSAHGLAVDGIVGPQTWQSLISD